MALSILTLLQAGPALIRAAGALLGGTKAETAETVARAVEEARRAVDPPKALEERLAALPPEQREAVAELQVRLAEIEAQREQARLEAGTARWAQTQETARVEARSEDPYVRRTRPAIARWSLAGGLLYVLIGAISEAAGGSFRSDPYLLSVILSPVWAYIGARSVDAFSPHKGPRLGR